MPPTRSASPPATVLQCPDGNNRCLPEARLRLSPESMQFHVCCPDPDNQGFAIVQELRHDLEALLLAETTHAGG